MATQVFQSNKQDELDEVMKVGVQAVAAGIAQFGEGGVGVGFRSSGPTVVDFTHPGQLLA